MEKLPDALRGDLQTLKETLKEQLSKLPVMDPALIAGAALCASQRRYGVV